jgi:hypothetical protein
LSPILGIIASQNYVRTPPSSYDSIATLAGSGSSITFSSIPSTYKHLQLRIFSKQITSDQNYRISFNGAPGGTSYAIHNLTGNGSTASAGAATSYSAYDTMYIPNNAGSTTYPITGVYDILDYTDTNKYKTARGFWGGDYNGSGVVQFESCLWMSTSAISSIQIKPYSTNFLSGFTASLYGIKG